MLRKILLTLLIFVILITCASLVSCGPFEESIPFRYDSSKVLELEDGSLQINVLPETEICNLKDYFQGYFSVRSELIEGHEYDLRTVPLENEGKNTFYLHYFDKDGNEIVKKLYVYRLHLLTFKVFDMYEITCNEYTTGAELKEIMFAKAKEIFDIDETKEYTNRIMYNKVISETEDSIEFEVIEIKDDDVVTLELNGKELFLETTEVVPEEPEIEIEEGIENEQESEMGSSGEVSENNQEEC